MAFLALAVGSSAPLLLGLAVVALYVSAVLFLPIVAVLVARRLVQGPREKAPR